MSVGRYTLGVFTLTLMISPMVVGARVARRRLLPDWSGALAGLADLTLAIGGLLALAQVLGTVGLFDRVAMATGAVVVGFGVAIALRGTASDPAPRRDGDRPGINPAELAIAGAASAVAAASLF